MNSVGGFREGEINGKPFHIFNFLSKKDNPSSSSPDELAIDSGGDDLPSLQPLFICQSFRSSEQWTKRRENDANEKAFLPVDIYPHFFNKRSGDQQFHFLSRLDIYDTCKLPLAPLFWCNNKEPSYDEFHCGVCRSLKLGTSYYFCVTCGNKFHKECIESPLEIKHPSYPFLSLQLYYPPRFSFFLSCFCCQEYINEMLYYCPTYKLILHPVCAMKPIPIIINYPKRHPHLLTFFPKQTSLACDVCGMIKEFIPTYICARCVFVVHQDCIYSPYVIRISRHHHRISFISFLPSEKWFCGVCRRNVNNDYGAYACQKCDEYFVHTRCALRKDLWDGEELEEVPEEPEIVVEPPFKRISDGIILHFSHDHLLKLEITEVYDEEKLCQACVFPLYEGKKYSCMDQCDFILHETCANAPCQRRHALHAHSLTLTVVTNEYDDGEGHFYCGACGRFSCGFVYEDPRDDRRLRLDLRYASVSEPFEYKGHEHPLFLALTPEEEKLAICQICQEDGDYNNYCRKLNCIQCSFVICFKCATLPYKTRYKHDKHLLTFRKKEEASDYPGWCDICESKIVFSRKGGFYSCGDYCSTTVHVDCLLGKHPYAKPGQTITYYPEKVYILRNKTMSRPFCHGKEHRCQEKIVLKRENMTFCSLSCLDQFEE